MKTTLQYSLLKQKQRKIEEIRFWPYLFFIWQNYYKEHVKNTKRHTVILVSVIIYKKTFKEVPPMKNA